MTLGDYSDEDALGEKFKPILDLNQLEISSASFGNYLLTNRYYGDY